MFLCEHCDVCKDFAERTYEQIVVQGTDAVRCEDISLHWYLRGQGYPTMLMGDSVNHFDRPEA